jgi:hypothetical protein
MENILLAKNKQEQKETERIEKKELFFALLFT